jgi:hypothetical protein
MAPKRKVNPKELERLQKLKEEEEEKKDQQRREKISRIFDIADQLGFVERNYDGALIKYEEILKEYKYNVDALNAKAFCIKQRAIAKG